VAYTFEHIEARDPNIPALVASNASVVIFAPGDATKTPLALTDTTGLPLANPVMVNAMGYGPAFISDLDRVAWEGGGFTGFFTSYEGMKEVAVASQVAAEAAATAASTASDSAVAEVQEQLAETVAAAQTSANIALDAQTEIATARQAAEDAALAAAGGGFAEDPGDPDAFIVTTKADGSVAVDPDDADALIFTT
jgi:hypothetical protein